MASDTKGEATRRRILVESKRLFAERGIKATTIAMIEAAVGLRTGSGGVHRYFATKDELVRAVLTDQIRSTESLRDGAQDWPLPDRDGVEGYLRRMGHYILDETEATRDVALISFREGLSLYERFPDLRQQNFAAALGPIADQIRASQAAAPPVRDVQHRAVDPEAAAFLLIGPLLYHRAVEWLTGETALNVTDDRLIEEWVQLFEPLFSGLMD